MWPKFKSHLNKNKNDKRFKRVQLKFTCYILKGRHAWLFTLPRWRVTHSALYGDGGLR